MRKGYRIIVNSSNKFVLVSIMFNLSNVWYSTDNTRELVLLCPDSNFIGYKGYSLNWNIQRLPSNTEEIMSQRFKTPRLIKKKIMFNFI